KAGELASDITSASKIQAPGASDLGVSKWFLTPQFNLERYGPESKAAISDILLTGERINRVGQMRLHERADPLFSLPKQWRSQGYEAVSDLIEAKTLPANLPPEV